MNRIARDSIRLSARRNSRVPNSQSNGTIILLSSAGALGYAYVKQEDIKEKFGYGSNLDKFRNEDNKEKWRDNEPIRVIRSEPPEIVKLETSHQAEQVENIQSSISGKDPDTLQVVDDVVEVVESGAPESRYEKLLDHMEPADTRSRDFEDFEGLENVEDVVVIEDPVGEITDNVEELGFVADQDTSTENSATQDVIIEENATDTRSTVTVPDENEGEHLLNSEVESETSVLDSVSETQDNALLAEDNSIPVETETQDVAPEMCADVTELVTETAEIETQTMNENIDEKVVRELNDSCDEVCSSLVEAFAETALEPTDPTVEEIIGQSSRIAVQTADSLIDVSEKAAKSIMEYINAKKYAFSFQGDTDRKIAIWLQVAEYQNEMDSYLAQVSSVEEEANSALSTLSKTIDDIGYNHSMGIEVEMDGIKNRMAEANSTLQVAKDSLGKLYAVEQSVEDMLEPHKQVLAELIGDQLGDDWKLLNPKFSHEDLKGLVFVAQKKIETYNEELKHLREHQDEITAKALQVQRDEIHAATQAEIEVIEKQHREKIERKREELRIELFAKHEEDLELQLKRQASAHMLHIVDELEAQNIELTNKYNETLEYEIQTLVDKYTAQIENERIELTRQVLIQEESNCKISYALKGYLEAIDTTIEERKKTEGEVSTLQTLLVGVRNLEEAINANEPVPLDEFINNLRKINTQSELLKPVLNSIPESAAKYGVLSYYALKNTFDGLKKAALENFLVDENNHGYFQLQRSRFCLFLYKYGIPLNPSFQEAENLDKLLTCAEHHMSQGDYEMAVRVLNQTSGEPRRIVAAWIQEARNFLEVKQAVDVLVLMSEARALSARCLS